MRNKWLWALLAVLPLVVGGLVLANSHAKSDTHGGPDAVAFICPITGEELPCPNCCPLNNQQTDQKQTCCSAEAKQSGQSETPFVCPLTGEELPCSKCCPLNQNE